jgi:zinc protease
VRRVPILAALLGLAAACAAGSPGRAPAVVTPAPVAVPAPAARAPRITPDAPFRAGPPAPTTPVPFAAPEPVTLTLRNGIPLTLLSQPSNLIAIAVVAKGGIVDVGADKSEVVGVMLRTMLAGSKTRPAAALETALADLSMPSFESSFFSDGAIVLAQLTAPVVKPGAELLADVVLQPAFLERDFAWQVNTIARDRDDVRTNPGFVAERTLRKIVFGRHPYAAVDGSSAEVRAVTRSEITALHGRLFDASRLSIVAAGAVSDKAVFAAIDAAFGNIARREPAPRALPAIAPLAGQRIVVVDRPGAPITRIEVGGLGPAIGATDVDSAETAVEILAGAAFGRIRPLLRQVYTASWISPGSFRLRAAGFLGWGCELPPEHVAVTLGEMTRQVRLLAESGPTEEELTLLRDSHASYLGGLFGSPRHTALTYGRALAFGLPASFVKESAARRGNVDAAAIRAAATRWLDPTRMRVVLVGDWTAMRESVTALGWGVSLKADAAP